MGRQRNFRVEGDLVAGFTYKDPYIKLPRLRAVSVPTIVEPYKYKTRRNTARLEPVVFESATPVEGLTGFVNNERASALEERFAIALRQLGFTFIFQYTVNTPFQLPGEGNKIDFIVWDGGVGYPIEPGASFIHKSPSQQEEANLRDAILNDVLAASGFQPIQYLPFDRPRSVDDAVELIRELFITYKRI